MTMTNSSTLFSSTIGKYKVEVDLPDVNPDKWIFSKGLDYKPDKDNYLLERFTKEYPNVNVGGDVDLVRNLISRSNAMQIWYSGVVADFNLKENVPSYLQNEVDPPLYDKAVKEINRISKAASDEANELAKLSREYDEKVSAIKIKYADLMKTDDKIALITTLKSTSLPLSLQLAIENFSPSETSSINKKTYAKEVLIQYKVSLLKLLKNDSSIDISDIISKMSTK